MRQRALHEEGRFSLLGSATRCPKIPAAPSLSLLALALLQNSFAEIPGCFLPDRSGLRAILTICRHLGEVRRHTPEIRRSGRSLPESAYEHTRLAG